MSNEVTDAAQMFRQLWPACCTSLATVRAECGRGSYAYLLYLHYLAVANAVVALPGVILALVTWQWSEEGSAHSYHRVAFLAGVFLTVMLAVAAIPWYGPVLELAKTIWTGPTRWEEPTHRHQLPEFPPQYERRWRARLSWALFLVLLFAELALLYFAVPWLHVQSGGPLLVAAFNAVVNLLVRAGANGLVLLAEAHVTYTAQQEALLWKLVLHRLCASGVLQAVGAGDASGGAAWQALWLLLLDALLTNVVDIVAPLVMVLVRRRMTQHAWFQEWFGVEAKERFSFADEYAKSLYHQYLAMYSAGVAPLLFLAVGLLHALNAVLDRGRLLVLYTQGEFVAEPVRPQLMVALHAIVCVCAVAGFPDGVLLSVMMY